MKDKYIIVKIKDKQYFLTKNSKLTVHKISDDEAIDVLLYKDGELQIGEPTLKGIGVEFRREDKKIKTDVRRYKSKSRYRKNKSHGQMFSELTLLDFGPKVKNTVKLAETK